MAWLTQREQICLSSTFLVLFTPSVDGAMLTHLGKGHLLLSVLIHMLSFPSHPHRHTQK